MVSVKAFVRSADPPLHQLEKGMVLTSRPCEND